MDDVENSKFEKYVQKDWDGNMTGKMSYILNRKLLEFKWYTYWTINGWCYGPAIFLKIELGFWVLAKIVEPCKCKLNWICMDGLFTAELCLNLLFICLHFLKAKKAP